MPTPNERSTLPNTKSPSAPGSGSGSITQIEPRVAAAVEALAAAKSTPPLDNVRSSLSGSGSVTQAEPRVAAAVAAQEAQRETETARTATGIEETGAIFPNALPSMPNARLVIASRYYLNADDTSTEDSAIIRLPQKISDQNIIGAIQRTHDVDFIIKLSLENRSKPSKLGYQIIYDPGSDDCLFVNQIAKKIALTCLTSPFSHQFIAQNKDEMIHPGIWRISLPEDDDNDNADGHHLFYFSLLQRQFSVTIREAGQQAKSAKRKRLENDSDQVTSAPPTTALSTSQPAVNNSTDDQQMPSASPREIVNKAAVPLLELADGEVAIVETRYPKSAANEQLSYELQRIKQIGTTPSTSVFTCQQSKITTPQIMVAKVLRYDGQSPDNLRKCSMLWGREKSVLEKLNHVSLAAISIYSFSLRKLTPA